MDAVAERVRRYIVDELGWDGTAEELTDDLPLIENGVLDSMGILSLVDFLESNYDITVDDTEIVPARLGTLASIDRFVIGKKS